MKGFYQYMQAGAARPRLTSYALVRGPAAFEYASGSLHCSAGTDFSKSDCCSVDAFVPAVSARGSSALPHNRVVASRHAPSGPFSFIWGASRWEFEGVETIKALGFAVIDVDLVDGHLLATLPLLDMRSTHTHVSSLPAGMCINVIGSGLSLVIGEGGVAYLSSEAGAPTAAAAALPPLLLAAWRLRYLAMSDAARATVLSQKTG